MQIHFARWIVPVRGEPVENAGIVTFGGRIVAVDRAHILRRHYHGKVTDHGDAIICPPLVNAHCHLELSPLEFRLKPSVSVPGSFAGWVRALIAQKETIQEHEWSNAIEDAVFQLVDNGVAVLGDVGNTHHVPIFIERFGAMWPFRGIFFHEIIAPCANSSPQECEEFMDQASVDRKRLSHPTAPLFHSAFSAHAPYTVAPLNLKAINAWNMRQNTPFSIHAAESEDETEFLKSGAGPLRSLMEERGHWPPDWKIPETSAIRYLDSLGCIHKKSICVHCVQADREDIEIISLRRASVCLCPRSNRFIGAGKPPALEMHRAGINLALGTDSLASNRKLSIFSEMAELAAITPGMPPAAILRAGTEGGARALGFEHDSGSLEADKAAIFLIVHGTCKTGGEAVEFLVNQAHKGSVNVTLTEG